jgi:hypothetical protein
VKRTDGDGLLESLAEHSQQKRDAGLGALSRLGLFENAVHRLNQYAGERSCITALGELPREQIPDERFEPVIRGENGASTYPVLLVDEFAAVFRRVQQFVDPAHAGIDDTSHTSAKAEASSARACYR